MLQYFEGTVFNVPADARVNTVNCVGAMGAGIALEFKLRFPEMFKDYVKKCHNGMIKVGNIDYFKDRDTTIVNFPTKMHFKYPSKIEWVEDGLKCFLQTYKQHNITSIAFPKLGTSNGGLDWLQVKPLMENYLSQVEADVYICLDEKKDAAGLELKMVEFFNQNRDYVLANIGRITESQKKAVENCKPITRFWHISKVEKIGAITYEKIFRVCKEAAISPPTIQLSLFDELMK